MAKTTTTLPISLLSEAQNVLSGIPYRSMENYIYQEHVINCLFRSNPATISNTNIGVVLTKVKTLNLYYSTAIFDVNTMAQGILGMTNFDVRLLQGDVTLVDEIAKIIPNRYNYSFATKYCACHKPNLFPIFDHIVGDAFFVKMIAKGNLPPFGGSQKAMKVVVKKYAQYKKIYDTFMQTYDLTSLSYREVDMYIWYANKLKLYMAAPNLFKLI